MSTVLTREDLWSLEEYAIERTEFRAQVMAHKKHRRVTLGSNASLHFEDQLTIRYQIQEMLRIEKVFDMEGIQDELNAYNPLIPDGTNWKATFMLEYDDPDERREILGKLIGIEKKVWVQVQGQDKVWPIANEDLERETQDKTASVHFLRFELNPGMIMDIHQGAAIYMGIAHQAYSVDQVTVDSQVRESLARDLSPVALN